MNYTEEQFNKLPKWAQHEIKRLENNAVSDAKKLAEFNGEAETNTFRTEGMDDKPLPKNSRIEFKVGDRLEHKASIYINRFGLIDVNTDSKTSATMVIIPQAANSFYIKFIER